MPKTPVVILDIDPAMPYNRAILRGISQYVGLHGPWLLKRHFLFYKVKSKQLPSALSWDADGIITDVIGKCPTRMIPKTMPAIFLPLKKRILGFPNIFDNDPAIGKMAAEHLIGRGFHEFAFCGFSDMFWSHDRYLGFNERIVKNGSTVNKYSKSTSRFRNFWYMEKGKLAAWLTSLPKPTGLMACNDDCSQFVLEACNDAGLKVPYDIAIIGVDNNDLICELSDPPLSSIALNTIRTGYEAAKLLDRMMKGKEKMAEQSIISQPTHVKVRQSTSIIAVADHHVAKALFFIQKNAKRLINVDDVVAAMTVSRRDLYRKFRKYLGHSIYQEIINARVELMSQMLIETNLSVFEIALNMGETSDKNISRYFRRTKGMSPRVYRQKYAKK